MKMNLMHSGLDEQSAAWRKTLPQCSPMLEKELESIYMERLL